MAQAPFVINPGLTAIGIDFAGINATQRGYIADIVLPRTRVDGPLFRYATYPGEEAFTIYDTQVGRLSKLNEIEQTASEATGAVLDWGLKSGIPFRDQMAAASQSIPMDPKARATRDVIDKVQLAREVRAAGLLFSAGNYLTGYKSTLAGTGQFSDLANSDPVQVIIDAAAGMLVKPNTAVMGLEVFNVLRRHPKVSVALGGSQESGRYVPMDELAGVLGVSKIVIGNTLQQTNKRGQALATSRIWGKHLALLNVPAVGGDSMVNNPAEPAFALTFQWGDKVAGEIPDAEMGLWGGVWVKAGESLVEKQVAQQAGYLFTNAIA